MKNILKLKYVLVLSGLVALSSCTDLDQDYPEVNKPIATMDMTSATIAEGESVTFTVMIDEALSTQSDFKIDLLSSSSGSMDDFTTDAPHLDEYEVGPEGWQVTVAPLGNSVSFTITPERDLDPGEGTETLKFRLTQGQFGNSIVSGGAIDFTVTVLDYDFCLWNFSMTDLYGDGWNGGYLEVISDVEGTRAFYAMDEDGQVNVPETTTVEVPIAKNANYTINYVSGGGTGAGPGWESENVYTITAPDGTEYSDGPIPTEGEVVSGVSSCN
ncbi:hypothetical protein [Hanstruepera ponticola]|uniref:hypothetical protein n=1 Tax=Hanstruepera ponticola TaxID=2042995 RepID=UPI00178364A1|nr:hypothetical protein [Hanstruepera ponticola]